MFSDRFRAFKIAGIVLFLVFSVWYSNRRNRYLTFAECLRNPERFAGAEVIIYLEPKIIAVTESYLLVSHPDGPMEVRIPEGFDGVVPEGAKLSDLRPGDSLEAVAVFRPPGYLELKAIRGAPLRRFKIALSIIPALVVAVLLFRSVRREGAFLVMKDSDQGGTG
jgi:hypothetical protein